MQIYTDLRLQEFVCLQPHTAKVRHQLPLPLQGIRWSQFDCSTALQAAILALPHAFTICAGYLGSDYSGMHQGEAVSGNVGTSERGKMFEGFMVIGIFPVRSVLSDDQRNLPYSLQPLCSAHSETGH